MTFVNFLRTIRAAFLKWRIYTMKIRIRIAEVKIAELERAIKEES